MLHSVPTSLERGVVATLAIVVVLLLATDLYSQKAQPTKKPRKKSAVSVQKQSTPARQDSMAVADSLKNVARARAVADSIKRAQEEAARLREDSLKSHRLRSVPNVAFTMGERLVFDVSYGPITAGEAIMQIVGYDSVAGRKTYKIQFSVNSLPSFSWIYKVEDRYLTFVDVETIAPWRFEQHIREGSYSKDFFAEFDQRKKVARTNDGREFQTPEYVHDIMSAFYYVRTMDLTKMKEGDMLMLHNFYDDASYELGVKVLGRQELEVEAGTFRTVVVEPLIKEGGLFKADGRIVVWLTDDDLKVPLRVNTKVPIGSIDTELREYSGLAGTLRARIR